MNADRQWIRDAALGMREDIEAELRSTPGRPDLADVLARARAIDDDAVPSTLRATSEAKGDAEQFDPELALFASALADEVEADVDARAMLPAATTSKPRRMWVATLAVAAAVLAMVVAVSPGSPSSSSDTAAQPNMAPKTADTDRAEEAWKSAPVRPAPTPEPPSEAAPEPAPERPTPRAKPRRSLDDLEREAMAAWKAGELERAETLFRTIIRRAGRGPKAELAYGDLFALTKQRGGKATQSRTWRQYLRRFPNGQHADDARAGLCMRAADHAASKCWRDYLSKHPQGAHAAQARRALE